MKTMQLSAALFAALLIFTACATVVSSPDELDIAIRDASDYLNDNIPAKSRIVILNIQSDSAALSDYIIDELIANAVNDHIFEVVDRHRLDLIRAEQNFQWSGEVDDTLALEIGKFFEAQTIVSGTVRELGDRYRFTLRALEVQTAKVQGQYNRNIAAGRTITALMRSGGRSNNTAYGTGRSGSGSGTSSGSGTTATTSGTSGGNRITAAQPAGPQNGTYTFWPRKRATLSGVPRDMYIPQIIVSNDYIVIYFTTTPQGEYRIPAIYNTNSLGDYSVQDLDNPSRFYSAVNAVYGGGQATVASVSFRRFPATRFKFTIGHPNSELYVFEEIVLGEPDS